MKIADMKGMILKTMLGVTAMGAMLFAGTAKADAQVAVGFRFGYPPPPHRVVVVPAYPRRDFYFDRRAEIIRHDEWLRAHRFDGRRGYR